jgi:cytochrome o ubiquinol oxidase operon protein cyoD
MIDMYKKPHYLGIKSKHEHGTVKSYVIGFLLSLLFTIIPYCLVTEHVLSGNALVATILGFGVLQMIVQIVFFLHLGREPKPRWNLVFFVATVGLILVVVVGSLWIMDHLHYNMTPVTPADASKKLIEDEGIAQIGGEKTGACEGVHTAHKVVIKDGVVSPATTTAQVCDTLIFINEDAGVREMTFGTHPHHGVYAGESELTLRKGRAQTVTLSEAGTYQFHDHLHAETAGSFTVMPVPQD